MIDHEQYHAFLKEQKSLKCFGALNHALNDTKSGLIITILSSSHAAPTCALNSSCVQPCLRASRTHFSLEFRLHATMHARTAHPLFPKIRPHPLLPRFLAGADSISRQPRFNLFSQTQKIELIHIHSPFTFLQFFNRLLSI